MKSLGNKNLDNEKGTLPEVEQNRYKSENEEISIIEI